MDNKITYSLYCIHHCWCDDKCCEEGYNLNREFHYHIWIGSVDNEIDLVEAVVDHCRAYNKNGHSHEGCIHVTRIVNGEEVDTELSTALLASVPRIDLTSESRSLHSTYEPAYE